MAITELAFAEGGAGQSCLKHWPSEREKRARVKLRSFRNNPRLPRGGPMVRCRICFDRYQCGRFLTRVLWLLGSGRGEVMATAADYRKLAEECFEWAREARDAGVREHYAKLGQIWLESAARTELRSGVIARPQPTMRKVA